MSAKTTQTRMTEGPIARQLTAFALPLLAASLIQLLYNTVDLIFVGRILGREAAAAVGASTLLVTCMVHFFVGISVGTGVVAATCFGGRRHAELRTTIHTAIGLALFGGAALTVIGIAFAPTFLRWLRTPEDILALATTYIRIYFLSLLSMLGYNFASGVIRALGNSRAPMIYQLIGGLSNVAGNALFIWVLGWGVRGAALATVLSQTVAMTLAVRHLLRLPAEYRLEPRRIRVDWGKTKEILAIGVPSGIQAMVITFSNLIVQFHINRLGVASIAAFTAHFKVENLVWLPTTAFGQAAMTFTGQNIGAGKLDRVRRGVRTAIGLGLAVTVGLSLFIMAFSRQAIGLFVNEPEVIEIGRRVLMLTVPLYFLYLFIEVLSNVIRGAGKALPPMLVIMFCICGLRILLLTVFGPWIDSAAQVALVYPVTWLATVVALTIYYRKGGWIPPNLRGREA